MGLHGETAGLWAGASIHEVAQVVAAGGAIGGGAALTVAVIVKLARVLMLAPVMAVMTMQQRRHGARHRARLLAGEKHGFIFRRVQLRHQGGKPVVHGADGAQRQGGWKRGRQRFGKGRFADVRFQRDIHKLLRAAYAHRQGRCEGQHRVRVKSLRIANGQAAAAQRALHGALHVQMADMSHPLRLFKRHNHSHPRHTSSSPHPRHPPRQSGVVWPRMARSCSSHK